jgi:hypothetical protein
MAKNNVRVIRSDGTEGQEPRWWARRAKKRGHGDFRPEDGVFVCKQHRPPAEQQSQTAPAVFGAPGTRAAYLIGQQWAQRYIPEFAADGRYLDPHGVLHFWADQGSSHGKVVALDGRRA